MSWRNGIFFLEATLPLVDKYVDDSVKAKFIGDLVSLLSNYDIDVQELIGMDKRVDAILGQSSNEEVEAPAVVQSPPAEYKLPEDIVDLDLTLMHDTLFRIAGTSERPVTQIFLGLSNVSGELCVDGVVDYGEHRCQISKLPIPWNLFVGIYFAIARDTKKAQHELRYAPTKDGRYQLAIESSGVWLGPDEEITDLDSAEVSWEDLIGSRNGTLEDFYAENRQE